MFNSLRNRLVLSHILPVLLIIPLMGAALGYVVETRLLLPMVYQNLGQDATLVAQITRAQPAFWQQRGAAQALVDGIDPYLSGAVSFITLDGRVLASSGSAAGGVMEQQVELPDLRGLRPGEVVALQNGAFADAFAPVFDPYG
ncbi:MAG: hypothetical protein ACKOC5_11525, partial [Chloroflexota bacterium]